MRSKNAESTRTVGLELIETGGSIVVEVDI